MDLGLVAVEGILILVCVLISSVISPAILARTIPTTILVSHFFLVIPNRRYLSIEEGRWPSHIKPVH